MRAVGVLLLEGTRWFDVAVATEVWGRDWSDLGVERPALRMCGLGRRAVRADPLGQLRPTHGLTGLHACDLVVVPGRDNPYADVPVSVCRALRRLHADGRRIAALCSGAFTLAAAGLLDGVEATTHWRLLDSLESAAPAARIRHDVLFTDSGSVLTSSGVVSGLDLCMHLIRCDHGAGAAAALARRLVMPPVREGEQRQFALRELRPRPKRPSIAELLDWATDNLAEPIGVPDLAAHVGISERSFLRAFTEATGMPPGRWLRLQRIREAQRLLETTDLPMTRVAARCGLGTAANLRRRFRSAVGVGPAAYRRAFRRADDLAESAPAAGA